MAGIVQAGAVHTTRSAQCAIVIRGVVVVSNHLSATDALGHSVTLFTMYSVHSNHPFT